MTSFTRDLAKRAASVDAASLTESQLERVRQCVLDWVGVTIAGAQEEMSRLLRSALDADIGEGHCSLLGTGVRAGPQAAALANGTAAHAHDFDDISFWMHGHPSVTVASPVFALAECRGASSDTVIAALVAGFEVGSRVGIAVGTDHYVAGWHSTGTLGTFAAAAGAGRVLGLDSDAMEHALGLAATQAAGLKVSFGTMAKPFHGGRAAASGVLAALLAEQGFTAGRGAIEGAQGFAATQAPGFERGRLEEVMNGRLGLESISFKRHAACGATHATIDAMRAALLEDGIESADIAGVRLRVTRQMLDICCIPEPVTGHEGMFSVRHAGALVLTGRSTGVSGFTDETVLDEDVVAARELFEVAPHPDRAKGIRTEVTIRLHSGGELVYDRPERVPVTDDELPAQRDALIAKFKDLVEPVCGVDAAAALREKALDIDRERDVAALLRLATPEGVTA